jgi:hypothetical protein
VPPASPRARPFHWLASAVSQGMQEATMIELRILALVGLIVTIIVSALVTTGVATLAQRIPRARRAMQEPVDAGAPSAGSRQAAWRLR